MSDPRRRKCIRTSYRSGKRRNEPPSYALRIDGKLWAAVEWSETRQRWCIEDASGECLQHVEHQHGEHPDADEALSLAKEMIRDGRMPTPEEAAQRLDDRTEERAELIASLDDIDSLPRAVADFLELYRDRPDLARSNSFQRLRAELSRHVRAHVEKTRELLDHERWNLDQHTYQAKRYPSWQTFVDCDQEQVASTEAELERWLDLLGAMEAEP